MTDAERKVYRIVFNHNHIKDQHAKYNNLLKFTGKTSRELDEVLAALVDKKLIWWDKGKTKDVALREID
ncbi:hypothetical protein HXA31_20015 [Salipaludibacillus agaradhaerens]|uniref:hypothetical protein n=1 Tax=Salipaludibacillus TaxID=1884449 RepID=UPI0020D06040|nr:MULTISPECIES: hypothetical protein [Salipaludibacillus]MCR6116617.1 hypothetical protein [Salipaludibacillus agaradhaerens]UTR13505.1 hypothetical protein MM221_12795 [Salipaludibacillus sp. LMS25]